MKWIRQGTFWLLGVMTVLLAWAGMKAQTPNLASVYRVGTTAGQFLKIGAGARPIGMGEAYSALATDILAVYWNPAGLARVPGNGEGIFNHANWLADIKYDFAAFSVNVGRVGSFGFQIISLRTPEQPVRTIAQPEGTGQVWNANMIALGVTYARNLTDRFAIGFTGKFVQETIFNVSARGAAFDLGILYDTPFKGLTLGASITNFGTRMQLDGRDLYFNADPLPDVGSVDAVPSKYRTESYDLPLRMRFGLAMRVLHTDNYQVTVALDGVQPNDNAEYLNYGAEFGFQNVIFLRMGYKAWHLPNSEQGLTFGAGIRYDIVGTNLKFDFGWADYGRLKDVKFVSLALRY